jgi:hypothetical protein
MLKVKISVPDHSLPARYRGWSGISNFVSSGGGSNGLWLGEGKGMARGSAREQKKYRGKRLDFEGLLEVWEIG